MSDKPAVPPPPPKRGLASALGSVTEIKIQQAPTPNNAAKPSDERLKDLNFKVDEAFHLEFKMTASLRRLTMKELLEASFQAWKDKHGGIDQGLLK